MPKTKNFKKGLIESIKAGGQMMIDMAEDIAGRTDIMTRLTVEVDFDPAMGSVPELTITRSHFPDHEKLEHILDSFYEEEEDESK